MASRSLGSLTLSLILQYGGFEQGLDRSARAADKRMKEIEARAKKFGAFMGGAITAGAGAATAAIIGLTKNAIDYADHLNDLNQRLGVSAEALSGWAHAAQQTGTDIDALGDGLRKLAKNMADALDPKSQQAGLFKALGIEITDAQGNLRSLEEVVPDVANAFQSIENDTTKLALAMELLGKNGGGLIEFFSQGKGGIERFRLEARELGAELSDKTLKAADEFKDQLSKLGTIGQAAGFQLAEKLLPPMTALVTQLQQGIGPGGDFGKVIGWIGDQAEAAVADIKQLKADFEDFVAIFKGIESQAATTLGVFKAIATLDFSAAKKSLIGLLLARDQTLEALSKDRFQFANVTGGSNTTEVSEPPKSGGVPPDLAKYLGGSSKTSKSRAAGKSEEQRELERLQESYNSLNERMREQIALFGLTGEAAKVRYEIEQGALQKLSETQKQTLTEQAEWLDWMNEMADIESAWAGVSEEATNRTLENMRRMQEEADRTKAAFVDAFRFEGANAIADFVTGAKSATDAAKDFFDNLGRMVTQMIAERWMEQLFGGIGTTGEGTTGGNWIGSLFGALFGGGKASGGPVSAGMFYRVNENGPEMLSVSGKDYLMMGNKAGMVTPRHALAGGTTLNQTFVVQGTPDNRTREQMARMSGREAARGMSRTGR